MVSCPFHTTVQISGAWNGAVLLRCSGALASLASARMFGLDDGEASPEQVHDALGELANILGGCVKTLLPEPCFLSLPSITGGEDHRPHERHVRRRKVRRQEPRAIVQRLGARLAPAAERRPERVDREPVAQREERGPITRIGTTRDNTGPHDHCTAHTPAQ